jgi:hypothetical protein
MKTSFKSITNVRNWRLAAITIGGTLAMSLATTAFAAAPKINSGNASGTVGVPFSYQITANQTIPNNGWGATGLPPGLSGPSATGLISGTPTTAAGSPFTVHLTATNSNGTGTADVTFTISNPPAPSLNGNNNATGTVGVAFSYQIQATNNPTSYNTSPNPPAPGLTVNTTTGSISGTPTTVGNYSVTLSATNAGGTGTKNVTFKINTGPTSIATISPTAVWEGDTVTLDGTQSHTNPPGGTLDYLWQQLAPPVGTLVIPLENPQPNETAIEHFTAPAPQPLGTLSWQVTYNLKVTDSTVAGGAKNTVSASVTTTVYAAPVADAEPKDKHVYEGTVVTLDGSGSTPQDGMSSLTYTWAQTGGTAVTLSDVHAVKPTFIAPQVGPAGAALTFTLVVTESRTGLATTKDSASPDSVTINVDNVNQPPTALANTINDPNNIVSSAPVAENTTGVTLYGFGTDPDGDALTFHWTQVHDASGAALQPGDTVVTFDTLAQNPSFTAPNLTTQDHVDLWFQLITNDGHLDSGPSYVVIRVNNTNDPPMAVPTATPASVEEGGTVTLDGHLSSDPNNDPLTYHWQQVGTPVVTLAGADSQYASFIAPTVSAQQGQITLMFNLTVDDGNGGKDTKPVNVTVAHKNLPPIADAGQPLTVPEMSNACLDGSGSYDPEDGKSVLFAWVQVPDVGEPIVSLDNANTSGPCFDTPNVGPGGATLHFQVTVTDSKGLSSSATVAVNVTYVNHPPTANPGNDQTVNEGDIVHLDGSNSTDPDGNQLTYAWSQFGGASVTIVPDQSDPSKVTFIAPQVFCAGDVVVMTLTVDDGYGGTDARNVNINVANVNNPPTAKAGGNQNAHTGQVVTLNGSGDDQDLEEKGSLTYHWEQVSNGAPTVTLSGANQSVANFTAPDVGGSSVGLQFNLTVTDLCGGSGTDVATITVANPIAVAQGPSTVNENASGMLNGSGSYDPDGDLVTYAWTQVDGPTVTLDDATSATPSFTAPWVSADSQVKFKLVVKDPTGFSSAPAYVTFTIINWNQPPDISGAHADVGVLWPPDHRMIQVQIVGVTDAQNNATIRIDKVTQDEPTNGLGDGDTPVDANPATPHTGNTENLRAERSGKGDGRVYWIYFTASDPETTALGTSPQGIAKVMVPHDKKTDTAIDSGQNYKSTQ